MSDEMREKFEKLGPSMAMNLTPCTDLGCVNREFHYFEQRTNDLLTAYKAGADTPAERPAPERQLDLFDTGWRAGVQAAIHCVATGEEAMPHNQPEFGTCAAGNVPEEFRQSPHTKTNECVGWKPLAPAKPESAIRATFEIWAESQGWHPIRHKLFPNNYRATEMQAYWVVWQASAIQREQEVARAIVSLVRGMIGAERNEIADEIEKVYLRKS